MTAPSEQLVQRAFEMIQRAAVRGERCPMNGDGAVSFLTCTELRLRGWVLFHIRGKNWRDACLLVGVHAGKWTKRGSGRVYKIGGQHGMRRVRLGDPYWPLAPRIVFTELSPGNNPNASPRGLSG